MHIYIYVIYNVLGVLETLIALTTLRPETLNGRIVQRLRQCSLVLAFMSPALIGWLGDLGK